MAKKYKTIMFDLDGVLIDSKKNMREAWHACQQKFNIENSFEEYFSYIGRPFFEILSILNIKKDFESIKVLYDQTSILSMNLINFYPNVDRILKKCHSKKINLFVVTSKDKKRTNLILKDISHLFLYLSSPDENLRGKPYPDQINSILKNYSLNTNDCLYIGDTEVDQLAAKSANIDFMLAEWGYGPKPSIEHTKLFQIRDLLDFI